MCTVKSITYWVRLHLGIPFLSEAGWKCGEAYKSVQTSHADAILCVLQDASDLEAFIVKTSLLSKGS